MKDPELPVSINATASFFPIIMYTVACLSIDEEEQREKAAVESEATFTGAGLLLFVIVASLCVLLDKCIEAEVVVFGLDRQTFA